MKPLNAIFPKASRAGLTLVELMLTVVIFGVVLTVLNTVFISSNRVYGQTAVRAGQQMNEMVGLSVMTTELRTAGCDPTQVGIAAVMEATATRVRINADYDGNGAIATAEPSEDVAYSWDSVARTLSRDPGTGAQVVMRNVSALTFRYFNSTNQELVPPLTAAQRDLIRSIQITFTSRTRQGGDVVADTRVALRNE